MLHQYKRRALTAMFFACDVIGSFDFDVTGIKQTAPAFHTNSMLANTFNANVVKAPGCGHLIYWEEPEVFWASI